MRTSLRLVAIVLAALGAAQAQQAARPTAASKAGLLVAMVAHERDWPVQGSRSLVSYQTLWITRDAAGTRITARLPDIILPRQSGFWRLGVEHTCQFTPPEKNNPSDHGNIFTEDLPFAVPVNKVPVLQLEDAPCDARTAQRVLSDAYDPSAPEEQPADENAPAECGFDNVWFESVLPELVSVAHHNGQSEECEPRGYRWSDERWVQRPDHAFAIYDNPHKLPFEQFFGRAGRRAWERVIRDAFSGGDSTCPSEFPPSEALSTGWYLEHSAGAWHAIAFEQYGNGACQPGGDTGLAVPRALTGATPLPIPWAQLEKQLPNLSDAYLSPDRRWLVTQQTEDAAGAESYRPASVRLFEFAADKVGRKLLELPAQQIVMLEWAIGPYVDAWTSKLRALEKHGLPKPILKPLAATPEE